ncbi:hypothetical protein QYE76_046814 [Lolium multiflorum]|uniref:Aminotransferase-like plant mobile domain-containing protein n=1 Tax=Lolium multiflorum TaxID=4521 RepID=A0AAD8X115_LOLMU|nr:hypothetical protein QYE76_046814 [Lolium multiflorum]
MAESSNTNATVSGLKVSDILLPHPSLPNSMCLGPRSSESPAHLISCEANRIPFVNQNLDLTSWADCLRAWPNPPEGWMAWYTRVSKTHYATWETIGIADALSLSLSPLEKNENILKTIGYFWSDALNCFMFGHGPMTPTLLDVAMITGLDIASPSPSAFKLPKVPFTLSSKTECTSWGAYLRRYMKTKGPVTEREHTAFLNFWLEHFIFCGPSLAPTKNYLSLAYELAKGTQLGLGKLFLGEVYRSLQLTSVKLLSQKTVKTGGPWWFIQLWAQLYFQNQIPDFPSLATCTFPDANGKEIRCTSYGQALYSLPGSRLIPKEAAGWFKSFFQGLDDPLFFPYTESENFENPVSFRLDSFADDASTRHLYSIMIRPCFLPVGMSTSNRIIKPGYESYQPVEQMAQSPRSRRLSLHTSPGSSLLSNSPALKKVIMQGQPISPKSAPKSKASSGPVAPRASTQARKAVRKVAARKTLKRKAPIQENLHINEISSGDGEEVPMPSATLDLAASTSVAGQVANLAKLPEKPIVTSSAAPLSLGEGCDLSSLLAFDPESIEPAISKAGEEPSPGTVHGPLQHLKTLLSSSVEILVENPEAIRGILEEIQSHLPVTLHVKLWPAVTLSAFSAELEILRKELENLEESVRMTKRLIQEKETLIARSREEAQGLTADLKTDLAEIRALNSQLVTGKDEDDEDEIAGVDRIRADALHALDEFLQENLSV